MTLERQSDAFMSRNRIFRRRSLSSLRARAEREASPLASTTHLKCRQSVQLMTIKMAVGLRSMPRTRWPLKSSVQGPLCSHPSAPTGTCQEHRKDHLLWN